MLVARESRQVWEAGGWVRSAGCRCKDSAGFLGGRSPPIPGDSAGSSDFKLDSGPAPERSTDTTSASEASILATAPSAFWVQE